MLLVKLWAMRGTLHLLPSAELGTWLSAFGTYTHYGNRSRRWTSSRRPSVELSKAGS